MNNQRSGMFIPALIGGAVAGFLSAIPFFNCLCCIWIIGGAMLASYLLAKDSPVALTAGDGALVGIFTGIIAAAVQAFVNIPLQSFNREFFQRIMGRAVEYMEEMPPGWESWLEGGPGGKSIPMFFLGLVISVVVFSVLGALGGIIGISLFRKKVTQKTQGVSDASKNTGDRQP